MVDGSDAVEIARTLFLSPHTVRDHLKAIFAKMGVGSRGELVARLFADHYHSQVAATITRVLEP